MSHEIHAYPAKDNDEFPTEIAYFKRTAFDSLNKTIYQLLNCEDLNGEWSGINKDRVFSRTSIMNALGQLSIWNNDLKFYKEKIFLESCLEHSDRDVRIWFR